MSAVWHHKSTAQARNPQAIRADFPCFQTTQPLHYLDNAATTQKPAVVIEAIADCYRHHYGPVHRGLYPLAEAASAAYEQARQVIASFIGAPDARQLVFTRSATEAINLVARGWLHARLKAGDEIWVSQLEHHANYLPWQALCRETGAVLRVISAQPDGRMDIDACEAVLFNKRTRLIAVTYVSNVLGVIHPLAELCERAAQHGIPVLVDAAQAVGHMPVDVSNLNCDFLAFSAHKMFGPTGIGALYAKPEYLEAMEPLLLGGGMVDVVGETDSQWLPYPQKFEAGSPNLADAVGFAEAVKYLQTLGVDHLQSQVRALTDSLLKALQAIDGLQVYGPRDAAQQAGIVSFNLDGVHPHDLGQIAGEQGVAIRAGHHCSQPLMDFLGVAATARASLSIYNDAQDIDALVAAIHHARDVFA